jgi:hypothetical protein
MPYFQKLKTNNQPAVFSRKYGVILAGIFGGSGAIRKFL